MASRHRKRMAPVTLEQNCCRAKAAAVGMAPAWGESISPKDLGGTEKGKNLCDKQLCDKAGG